MKFHVEHALFCPSCGFLGHKARQRRRQARIVADAGHVAWAARIAREIRAERRQRVFEETDGGMFATMVELGPDPVPWEQLLAPPAPEQRVNIGIEAQWPREIRKPYPAVSLHDHAEGYPCNDRCTHYPAGEQIITILPDPTPDEQRQTWFNLPEGGPW